MTLNTFLKCFSVLSLFISISAKSVVAIEPPIIIENEIIKKEGSVIGKLSITKEAIKTFRAKRLSYKIHIYNAKDRLIAVYNMVGELKSGNNFHVSEANLKTVKDRARHAGSNFLDYGGKKIGSEDDALQMPQVLNYLQRYRYI